MTVDQEKAMLQNLSQINVNLASIVTELRKLNAPKGLQELERDGNG